MPVRDAGFHELITKGCITEKLIKRQSLNLGVEHELSGAYFIFDMPHQSGTNTEAAR